EAVDRLRAPRQSLQGRLQAQVVERRGPQLGDQVAQPIDLMPQSLERDLDRLLELVRILAVARVCELQPKRAHALDALVVDLARPARALALAALALGPAVGARRRGVIS